MADSRPKAKDVDEYLAMFDGPNLEALKTLRRLIKEIAPEAEETISYAIPAYKLKGRPMIYFAGFEKHVGIYPLPKEPSEKLAEAIRPYVAGTGTLKFLLDKPLPAELIRQVIEQKYKEAK